MFRNNIKIAWRNLIRDRQLSFLNLIGLSTGLACILLIFLWVRDERKVDGFFENDTRLFEVMKNDPSPDGIQTSEITPGLLAGSLSREMPEVEFAVPVIPVSYFDQKGILTGDAGEDPVEASGQFAGKDYFSLFSYHLLQGNKEQVLADKNSVVISDELARRIFHTTDNIVGKAVSWNQKDYSGVYRVSGVFQKPPANATALFDIVFSYELFLDKNPNLADWKNGGPSTYVMLKKGMAGDAFSARIAGFIKGKDGGSKATLFVQRYSDVYLHNHYENGVPSGGRIEYVRLFSVIALFILLIACINFMNLSTAKASARMKETGIKKVIGATRGTLVVQFLGESLLMSAIATGMAVLLVVVLLPKFSQITGKTLILPFDGPLLAAILGITVFTGLVAGSYPAIYLSGFRPAMILKGKLPHSLGELLVRKGLMVFQFTLSAIFIISVLVIYRQMHLVETKNLGYNRDHVIYFDKGGIVSDNKQDYAPGGKYQAGLESFLQRVRSVPGVVDAANFRHNITNRNGGTYDISWPGKDPGERVDFTDLAVGYHFIETMGIGIKEGRSYSEAFGNSERSKIIFNEVAIARMGIKDPIGKVIHLWGENREIVGVVKNFNFQSLYENLKPAFFDFTFNQRASKIMVRIAGGREKETIARLEDLYKAENQGLGFTWRFLDDDYQALYSSEKRVAALSQYFAGLAIIISCLGLFGLSAYTAQRRQKEIGIRKVVGASAIQVVALLSRDFLGLIFIALGIAFPVAWWAMSQWLHGFAYRVGIGPGVFGIAGASILLITLGTIAYQSVRAALVNPVNSLRSE